MYTSRKFGNSPYQETVESSKYLKERLYKGTIQTDQIISDQFIQMPGRANPYRYYNLPPDYYYPWDRHRKNTHMPNHVSVPVPQRTDSRTFRVQPKSQRQYKQQLQLEVNKKSYVATVTKDNKNLPFWNKNKNQIHPDTNQIMERSTYQRPRSRGDTTQRGNNKQQERDKKQVTQLKPQGPVTSHRKEPNGLQFARSSTRHTHDHKSQRQEYKRLNSNSPFQDQFPERQLPPVISPETMAFDPLYKLKAGTVFAPLLPVSVHDYLRSLPVTKIWDQKVNGNPLIPVKVSEGFLNNVESARHSPDSAVFLMSDDYDYTSLAWTYSGVPGYKAVGSILSETDSDDY